MEGDSEIMINFSYDSFLDMINLSIQEKYQSPLTKAIVLDVIKRLVVNLQEYVKLEPMFDTTENRYFINIVHEILTYELSLEDRNKLIVSASKWIKDFPSDDLTTKRILSDILLSPQELDHKYINVLYKKMKLTLLWCISDKEIKSIAYKMKKINNTSDMLTQEVLFQEIFEQGKKIINDAMIIGSAVKDNVNVESINMSCEQSIKEAFKIHNLTRSAYSFQFGLQGLNDMIGKEKLTGGVGLKLGEFVLFGALSFNYKSGMMLDILRWMSAYNQPPKIDDKVPVILFITLENEATNNMIDWYRRSYIIKHGELPPDHFTEDDMASFIKTNSTINGWEVHIFRKLSGHFGMEDYIEMIENFKRNGRRVYISIIDYLGLFRLGPQGAVIDSPAMKASYLVDLFDKMHNYTSYENILTITPHQLSPEAGSIAAQGGAGIVKKFNGQYHFETGKKIYHKVTTCILMHIEKNSNKVPFLTFAYSKRRYYDPPSPELLSCAYPFHKSFGILDDYQYATSQAVYDIYSYRGQVEALNEEDDLSILR